MSTVSSSSSMTTFTFPRSLSPTKESLKPNAHPYPIKTTSSALLSRSNSSPHHNSHHTTNYYYVPPAHPPSPKKRTSQARNSSSHRYSRSLTTDLPRPLPPPPLLPKGGESAGDDDTPRRLRRAETLPGSMETPATDFAEEDSEGTPSNRSLTESQSRGSLSSSSTSSLRSPRDDAKSKGRFRNGRVKGMVESLERSSSVESELDLSYKRRRQRSSSTSSFGSENDYGDPSPTLGDAEDEREPGKERGRSWVGAARPLPFPPTPPRYRTPNNEVQRPLPSPPRHISTILPDPEDPSIEDLLASSGIEPFDESIGGGTTVKRLDVHKSSRKMKAFDGAILGETEPKPMSSPQRHLSAFFPPEPPLELAHATRHVIPPLEGANFIPPPTEDRSVEDLLASSVVESFDDIVGGGGGAAMGHLDAHKSSNKMKSMGEVVLNKTDSAPRPLPSPPRHISTIFPSEPPLEPKEEEPSMEELLASSVMEPYEEKFSKHLSARRSSRNANALTGVYAWEGETESGASVKRIEDWSGVSLGRGVGSGKVRTRGRAREREGKRAIGEIFSSEEPSNASDVEHGFHVGHPVIEPPHDSHEIELQEAQQRDQQEVERRTMHLRQVLRQELEIAEAQQLNKEMDDQETARLEREIAATRSMVAQVRAKLEDVEAKIKGMEEKEWQQVEAQEASRKEQLKAQRSAIVGEEDDDKLWVLDPRTLFKKFMGRILPSSLRSPASAYLGAGFKRNPLSLPALSVSGLPSYVILVGIGMCAVVLKVVLRRLLRGNVIGGVARRR